MYKLKTTRSVNKRFKVSARGKVLRHNACKSHLLQKKSSKIKRRLRKVTTVCNFDQSSLNRSLPYLK